jgi:hypothetical protein
MVVLSHEAVFFVKAASTVVGPRKRIMPPDALSAQ